MAYSYNKRSNNNYWFILLGVVIGLSIGLFLYYQNPLVEVNTVFTDNVKPMQSQINLLAVDQDGNGITTPLIVDVMPGDGKILTDIEKLLFWVDTQYSIQTARDVAFNITGKNVNDYDVVYTISSDAAVVGGPSAGAALTVATVAALENKTIRDNIVITGTVEEDGSIGQVGGVLEKAIAAKDIGAEVFLVPVGQGYETYYEPEENCTRRAGFVFCETNYNKVTVNIGEDAGIAVMEVENVSDALKYFGL